MNRSAYHVLKEGWKKIVRIRIIYHKAALIWMVACFLVLLKLFLTCDKNIKFEKRQNICDNIADATVGHWDFKDHLTRFEVEERKRLDTENRVRMNWPPLLYRNDLRCGKDFPIPGYRVRGQCDSDSTSPCCDHVSGWCGNTSAHCVCPLCTDLRTMIPAEIGRWIPEKCDLRRFSHEEICSLFNKHNISMTFLGDSLIRHMHTVLLLMITNNYYEGSIPIKTSDENRKLCRGEHQITSKKCSVELVAQTTNELSKNAICTGKNNFFVDIIQDYHRTLIPEIKTKIKDLLGRRNSWIIAGVGLHYQLDFEIMKTEYLDKVWAMLQSSSNGWPRLIWIGIHGTFGFLRLDTDVNNNRKIAFNKKVNDYWTKREVVVIETFNMSSGIRSFDGRHYGIGFNELKIQMIVNLLYQQYNLKYSSSV